MIGKESLFTEILETSEEIKLKLDGQRVMRVSFYNVFLSKCKKVIYGIYLKNIKDN